LFSLPATVPDVNALPSATRRRWPLLLFGSVIAAALLLVLYTWLVMSWSYSDGERAGYVQKFSRKGWICKTWEGELAMVAIPGTLSEKFLFTVRDPGVAAKIEKSMGKRVAITYEQHVGIPTACFGDTQHFIVDLRVVE
jgi:hypothetical protein